MRRLQKCDTVWAWESEQQTAFEKIKTALTTLPVLTYFDKEKDDIRLTDASKTGLSVDSVQSYYKKANLTDTRVKVLQHRELLGVVFGLKSLHQYTFGKSVTVETDHQPLTSI